MSEVAAADQRERRNLIGSPARKKPRNDMLVCIVCPARNRRVVVPDRDEDLVACSLGNFVDLELPRVVTQFVREEVNVTADGTYVAFRVNGTRNYLTAYPQGEGRRSELRLILSHLRVFMPDLVEDIVNFVLPSPLWLDFPIRAERGPPNFMQIFRLVRTENGRNHYGIQTYDGSYLCCAPWADMVTQSPDVQENGIWEILCARDEE